ncbi:MAG: hypothetical protein Q9226_007890 [Calogaya cf. arnoldii]
MQVVYWLLFAFLSGLFCHAAPALRQENSVPNLSTLPHFPDARFKIQAIHLTPLLPEPSCRMAIMVAMRYMTLLNYEDSLIIPTAKAFSNENFIGGVVLVSPAQADVRVSIRFVIWALYEAMRDTLNTQFCTRTNYVGTWEGKEVVNVRIIPEPASVSTESQMKENAQRTSIVKPVVIGSQRVDEIRNSSFSFAPHPSKTNFVGASDQLYGEITYHGKTMDPRDFFIAAMGIMLRLAPTNRQELGVFRSIENAITTDVESVFNRAARTLPYIMTSGDLISLLAVLPESLLKDKKWQEMDITVFDSQYSGFIIARVTFRIGGGRLMEDIGNGSIETS